jgi:AraC-like DNA-binding protein
MLLGLKMSNKSAVDDPFFRAASRPTMLPYKVRSIGHTHSASAHISRGTYHDDATLIVVLAGKGEFSQLGQTIRLRAGLVGLILPGEDPGVISADDADPYNFIHCRYAGNLAMEVSRRIFVERGERSFFRFAAWAELAEILERGIELHPGRYADHADDRPKRVDAILAEALAFIDNPEAGRTPGKTPVDGQSIRGYMLRQIHSPIALDPMADFFGVSKHHLCRVARRDLGRTIQVYWEAMKVAHADLMLSQFDLSIKQVGARLGYDDPFYFSRVFRKHRGISPREFRARQNPRNTEPAGSGEQE